MQIFVSEFLTCGACSGELHNPSLAAEGRAMVEALICDLADVPGWRVVTTWDARLKPPRFSGRTVDCHVVRTPGEERTAFREFAAACDATLVIAPEFQSILTERCRLVQEAGGRWIGCAAAAIALCADKLRLAAHLSESGVRTIPTWPLPIAPGGRSELPDAPAGSGALAYPLVIKPRDGAGSQQTWLAANETEFQQACRGFRQSEFRETAIVQPFVRGRAFSVAAVISGAEPPEILPLAEQHLSGDGRFHYLGGRVCFPPPPGEQAAAEAVVREACRAVPGLAGYVGFDLIVPDDNSAAPILVEINPRLTTSYLGYRQLIRGLARRIVAGLASEPLEQVRGELSFRADGTAG